MLALPRDVREEDGLATGGNGIGGSGLEPTDAVGPARLEGSGGVRIC